MYSLAVDGVPAPIVWQAVQRFVSGKIERKGSDFPPSAEQFAREARRLHDEARAAAYVAIGKPAEKPVSPEEREKVAALLAGLSKRIAAPKSNRQEILDASPEEELAALASQPIRVSADLIQRINQGQ